MNPIDLIPPADVIPVHWGWLKLFFVLTRLSKLLYYQFFGPNIFNRQGYIYLAGAGKEFTFFCENLSREDNNAASFLQWAVAQKFTMYCL